jgi:hypothetical protein
MWIQNAEDSKWKTTTSSGLGLDFGFFNNRVDRVC